MTAFFALTLPPFLASRLTHFPFFAKINFRFLREIYALGSGRDFICRRIPQTKRSFYEKLRVYGYLPDGRR